MALDCGLNRDGTLLTPELNEHCEVIGIQHRNGEKKSYGNRGLVIPDAPPNASGPLLIRSRAAITGRWNRRRSQFSIHPAI